MNLRSSNRRTRRVHLLPSLLTLGNFSCGFFAIVLCLNALFFATRAQIMDAHTPTTEVAEGSLMAATAAETRGRRDALTLSSAKGSNERAAYMFHLACIIIFLGMLFDVLDGKVARFMGADSAFGTELDSLADVTTFGVAPPVIVNTLWIAVMPVTSAWWGQVLIFGVVYAVCGVLRLARYNIQTGSADKNIFTGLPSPAAAGCVVTAVLVAQGDYGVVVTLCEWLSEITGPTTNAIQMKANLLAVFILVPGLLMVSNVPYTHLANRYLTGKKSFTILVLAVLLFALLWYEPRLVLFAGFNGYMLLGIINAVRKKHSGPGRKAPAAGGDAAS